MATITIKGGEYATETPRSVSEVLDVLRVADRSPHRAMAAAIGLAVPKVARQCRAGGLRDHGYDAAAWGGVIYDEMMRQGVTMAELTEAGSTALGIIAEVVPTEQEVETEVGFSDATPST